MKVRDNHAKLNGDATEYVMPSGGLQIIGPSGSTLFSISLEPNFTLRVDAGDTVLAGGVLFTDRISIMPRASNVVTVHKVQERYEPK